MYETFQFSEWQERWRAWTDIQTRAGHSGTASVNWVTTPGQSFSKSAQLNAGGPYWYEQPGVIWDVGATAYLENIAPDPNNYWSFLILGWSQGSTWRDGGGSATVSFLDSSGQSLSSYTLGGRNSPAIIGLYEFLRLGTDVYLLINGESKGIIGSWSEPPSYIRFTVGGHGIHFTLIIDSIYNTPDAGLVSIGIEPQSRTLIDLCNPTIEVCWCVTTNPYAEFRDSEYRILVSHPDTGTVVFDQVVKSIPLNYVVDPPYGCVSFSRDVMRNLDNMPLYGAYLIELLKNGQAIATEFLQYTQYGIPETCEQRVVAQTEAGSPLQNAAVEVREYLSGQLVSSGTTDANGEWSTVLDTAYIYSIQVSWGQQVANTVIVPCYENPVTFVFQEVPPEPVKRSWLVPALLAALGATGGATWGLSD